MNIRHAKCVCGVPKSRHRTRNAQNGHNAAENSHNRGEEVNYCGKNNVVEMIALLLCIGGEGDGVGFKSGPGKANLTEFGLHRFLQENTTVPDISTGPPPCPSVQFIIH